jgi:hypothetical protein
VSQIDRNEILELIGVIVLSIALGAISFWLVEKSLVFVKIITTVTS